MNKLLDKLLANSVKNLDDKSSPLLLTSLFSKTEIEMFKKRLGIILFLELGATNDEIAQALKTTQQTIIRIKSQWKHTPPTTKNVLLTKLKNVLKKEQTKSILKELFETTLPLGTHQKRKRWAGI